jgi:putative hydrolase of the HAD superfamily
MHRQPDIKLALFDFGGVLAEEGFLGGLAAIAEKNGLDAEIFLRMAFETAYELGLVTGRVRDVVFWDALHQKTGIRGTHAELSEEILSRMIIRPWMLEKVDELKGRGVLLAILSDQCHWLDELDRRHDFFRHFDHIFNSYHVGLTKNDPAAFDLALTKTNVSPEKALFIDDHLPHVKRARSRGLNAIHFNEKDAFLRELQTYFP